MRSDESFFYVEASAHHSVGNKQPATKRIHVAISLFRETFSILQYKFSNSISLQSACLTPFCF